MPNLHEDHEVERYAYHDGALSYTPRRCYVWSGGGGSPAQMSSPVTPTAGGDIDGVSSIDGYGNGRIFIAAVPGVPIKIEAAAAFSIGASSRRPAMDACRRRPPARPCCARSRQRAAPAVSSWPCS